MREDTCKDVFAPHWVLSLHASRQSLLLEHMLSHDAYKNTARAAIALLRHPVSLTIVQNICPVANSRRTHEAEELVKHCRRGAVVLHQRRRLVGLDFANHLVDANEHPVVGSVEGTEAQTVVLHCASTLACNDGERLEVKA